MKKNKGYTTVLFILSFICSAFSSYSQTWNTFGDAMDGSVNSLATNPGKDTLYMGGGFINSGTAVLYHIGRISNNFCMGMGMPMGADYSMMGTDGEVDCIIPFHGMVYIGGSFTKAESFTALRVSVWNQGTWLSVGNGFNNTVRCMIVYKDEIYAGGEFTSSGSDLVNHIAKWNGTKWVAVGTGLNDDVESMIIYKGNLIVSGDFDSAGTTLVNHISKWDGTKWTSLGSGMTTSIGMNNMGMPAMVHSLCEYNNRLYAGGMFMYADGKSANNMAVWNDTSWSNTGDIGTRMTDIVQSMTVYNYRLIAGGYFDKAGNQSANNIAAWNGTEWSALGQGVDSNIEAFTIYKNHLIVGGNFNKAGGNTARFIAQWAEATGIDDGENPFPQLRAYPNPSDGKFYLSGLKGSSKYNLTVTNSIGITVLKTVVDNSSAAIPFDLGACPNGIYFIRVNSGSKNSAIQLVIGR